MIKPPSAEELLKEIETLRTINKVLVERLDLSEQDNDPTLTDRRRIAPSSPTPSAHLHALASLQDLADQLRRQTRFQDMLAEISATFINLPLDWIDATIETSLGDVGGFLGADRVYLFECDDATDSCSNTHEWCSKGTEPRIDKLQEIPLSLVDFWSGPHRTGTGLNVPNVSQLPNTSGLRRMLEPQGVQSHLTCPLIDDSCCLGFLGFDFLRYSYQGHPGDHRLLKAFAHVLLNLRLRRKAEESVKLSIQRTEAANKAKGEFLASMTHEIRNPLSGILGLTEVLLDEPLEDEPKNIIETINSTADRLLELTNDILDFSKIEAGRIDLEEISFDLRQLFRDFQEILRVSAKRKGLQFSCQIMPETPTALRGDPARLQQILMNLVGNALKFTSSGFVQVLVTPDTTSPASADSCRLLFRVRDSGPGIPQDKLPLLFKKFSQADSSISRKFGGTGLGLAISQQLSELMGGTIGVRSPLPAETVDALPGVFLSTEQGGPGAEFWFTVELRLEPSADKSPPKPVEPAPPPLLPVTGNDPEPSPAGESAISPVPSAQPSSIPAVETEESLEMPEAPPPACEPMQASGVLIVEDNPINQMVAKGICKALKLEADLAANGREAIAALSKKRYQLVFMDIQMPGLDGLQATRQIRDPQSSVLQHDIAIIAMTANAIQGDREECLAAGMSDYLAKPTRFEKVKEVVEKWLGQPHPL